MDFKLESTMIRQSVRDFAEGVLAPKWQNETSKSIMILRFLLRWQN